MQSALEGKIDFHGQHLVDQTSKISLIIITAISFIVGFVAQSLKYTFATFGVSTLLLALVIIPPWPMYNKNPPKWLPVIHQTDAQGKKS